VDGHPVNPDFTSKFNNALLKNAIISKAERVLYKTGAYALQVIRRSIRAPKKAKNQTIALGNRKFIVPPHGLVLDAKTKKPVPSHLAATVRHALRAQQSADSAGSPPRRGPKDTLRKAEKFTVDPKTFEVTAGPIVFGSQPQLVGASDVPEILEGGGSEKIKDQLVKYAPHPFIRPAVEIAKQRMAALVESEQLRP
jgi:hypothetical protein